MDERSGGTTVSGVRIHQFSAELWPHYDLQNCCRLSVHCVQPRDISCMRA